MPEKYTYLAVNFFCILFPLAFSFYPKIRFYRQWRYFLLPCLATALFFITWDIVFTAKGVWSFNPDYVIGISFYGLPLEELLFFICIPYACVFTYYCIRLFFNAGSYRRAATILSIALVIFLSVTAVRNLPRLYTSVTFSLLAIFLLCHVLKKTVFLASFYISFLIILLPFFIANGVLTGSFISAPVVRYNGAYNLGIRMFTIPFEDIFYGMLLLLMNITGFEYFKYKALTKIISPLQL